MKNWYDTVRRLLALGCEESSRLSSRGLDEPLGGADRLALWGHLAACRSCRRFRSLLGRIGDAYRRRGDGGAGPAVAARGLTPEARRRIAEALERVARDGPGGEHS